MRPSTIAVLLAAESIASVYSLFLPELSPAIFARDTGICDDPRFFRCPDENLPSNFCCPKSSKCLSLDDSTTLVCCPQGRDCTTIQPIICDIQRQNVLVEPLSAVKTTRLSVSLLKCGNGCCPHGYRCDNGSCRVNPISSTSVSSTSTTATSTTTTTSEPTSSSIPATSSSSTTSTPIANVIQSENSKCSAFPGPAIAAGFFPGFIAGILLSLALCFCLRQRDKNDTDPTPKPLHFRQRSDDHAIISISDPIPSSAQDSIRTDFLRHKGTQEKAQKSRSIRARASTRVRSFFAPKLTVTIPDASTMPFTPPTQIYPPPHQHNPSIRVCSPIKLNAGDARPSRRESRPPTTFSEMMESAGLQNGRGTPFYAVHGTSPPKPMLRRYQNEYSLKP